MRSVCPCSLTAGHRGIWVSGQARSAEVDFPIQVGLLGERRLCGGQQEGAVVIVGDSMLSLNITNHNRRCFTQSDVRLTSWLLLALLLLLFLLLLGFCQLQQAARKLRWCLRGLRLVTGVEGEEIQAPPLPLGAHAHHHGVLAGGGGQLTVPGLLVQAGALELQGVLGGAGWGSLPPLLLQRYGQPLAGAVQAVRHLGPALLDSLQVNYL